MSPNYHRIIALEFRFKIVLQVLVKLRFRGELQRMIPASPAEIAVNDGNITQRRGGDFRHDNVFFAIIRETASDGNGRGFLLAARIVMAFCP